MDCFFPTYKHRFEDYNAEDVLLVNQPPSIKRMLSIKMQSGEEERKVKCVTTPSFGDCLVRVYDGGFSYGVIIAPFDPGLYFETEKETLQGRGYCIRPRRSPPRCAITWVRRYDQ